MSKLSHIPNLARQLALIEIEKYWLPHILIFEISEKKALELAHLLWADRDVVATGVYLMDIKLGQASEENNVKNHVNMGSEAAKVFLEWNHVDDLDMKKILNCIEAHHAEIPFQCLEAEICANADCYRFIHPKGFFLWLTTLGKRWLTFDECLNQAEYKLDEKYKILSLDVCKTELEPYYQVFKKYIHDARSM